VLTGLGRLAVSMRCSGSLCRQPVSSVSSGRDGSRNQWTTIPLTFPYCPDNSRVGSGTNGDIYPALLAPRCLR
jgi:hypothetical protein